MENRLEQANITYYPVEDRLLLKVNAAESGEYRIWLTRRYTEILGNILAEIMETEGGIQDIASHHDTISYLKNGVFEQEYGQASDLSGEAQASQAYPLGAGGILGFRITYGREDSGNIQLQLLPAQGPGLNFSLNRSMLFLMYNLLEQGVAKTDWKLRLPQQHKDPVH